jgi:LysR family transcriptional regulator, glycine cleavage system transcriptional activator
VRADWLIADQLFPVCSPALLTGKKPLRKPEDLADHVLLHSSSGDDDDWRLWLTAAGLPTNLSKQPGVTFDLAFMTLQAAIDGIGVAIGRTSYVEADIAKGRLVVPFKMTLPADAGFYLVSPEARADTPKLSAFRHWLIASAQNKT